MTHPPVVDRSEGRAAIRAELDRQAREAGHADHKAAGEAEYAEWQGRAVWVSPHSRADGSRLIATKGVIDFESATDDAGMGVRDKLWDIIAEIRDASPRLSTDADTDEIVDAILAAGFGDVAGVKAAAWDEGWDEGFDHARADGLYKDANPHRTTNPKVSTE